MNNFAFCWCKQCPKKGKQLFQLAKATVAEAQMEPTPTYKGPSEPRDEEGRQGSALEMIQSMNDDEHTKLLDNLCVK
jgi:hypothetical protein